MKSYITFSVIVLAMMAQFYYNILFWRSFDENTSRLDLMQSVNSASDLATEYLLEYSQITDYGNIFIEPDTVWDIYKHCLLRGIALYSEKNMHDVDFFFPSVVIAVNDGYFIRLLTQVDTPKYAVNASGVQEPAGSITEWEYKFTQKLPFSRYPNLPTQTNGYIAELGTTDPIIPANTASNPVIIADTLEGRNVVAFYPNSGKYIKYQVEGKQLPSTIGTAHSVPEIGKTLLTALDYSMSWNASNNSLYKRGSVIRIPLEIEESLSNDNISLIGPQVMAIADQFSWLGNTAMSFYTMSNTQIIEQKPWFCYTRNGHKYYSMKLPTGITSEQIFSNPEQCALMGYEPDPTNY